jgi:dolichol-phosphate mannosyltransferase
MDGPPQSAPARRLSLVLPAYNEEAGITRAVAEADDALAALAVDYEVLVVDDGSSDRTAAVVGEEAARRPRVRLLRHERNLGYGAALRTGFTAARFELVAFTDADCQFHLEDLSRLLPLTDRCPVAVGYRVGRQDPWRRRFLSGGFNLLTRVLLGTRVRDVDCALKVFRREALADLMPESDGFFVNTEMLTRARQLGFAVAEAGVRHRPRLRGVSKVGLHEVPRILGKLLPFWWSRVLFPGPRAETNVLRRSPVPALVLLLALAALLFFSGLQAPLLEPQEARYAEIPRQMLTEGRLLVPVLHGEPYLDKPPLLYWLVMASYRTFGVHDWTARLVPGLAGLLTVVVTFFWGRRMAGEGVGLAGALALCLSARFVYLGRMLLMDGVLCLTLTAALAAAHAALAGKQLRRSWWLLSAGACALGLLTKGPIALVLVAGPVLGYRLLDARCARIGVVGWILFLAVACGLAAPWYVAVMQAEPGFASDFFLRHNVERFAAGFDHREPVWYYLPGLLLGMLPWTLLLPGLVRFLGRRSARQAARRPAALGFFLLAALMGLLFFSMAACKRPAYLLPIMPPFSLALGCYLDARLPRSAAGSWAAWWQRGSRLAYRATFLVLIAGLAIAGLATRNRLVEPGLGLGMAALALAGLAILLRGRRVVPWAASAAATFAVLFVGVQELLPAYNGQYALRNSLLADAARADARPLTVVCYPKQYDSVSFYLPGAEVRAYSTQQQDELIADLRSRSGTLLLVKSGATFRELLGKLPSNLEFVARGRKGDVTISWVRPRARPDEPVFARQP